MSEKECKEISEFERNVRLRLKQEKILLKLKKLTEEMDKILEEEKGKINKSNV